MKLFDKFKREEVAQQKCNINHIIDETIEDLKNNSNACTLEPGMISLNNEIVIPESHPGEKLSAFISFFYDSELVDKNYVLNMKKIKDKSIENFTKEEIATYLTAIIRGERFNSGLIYSMVKDGTMLKLVERLKALN